MDINVKCEIMKLLEKKGGENFRNLGVSKEFSDLTQTV